MLALVLAGISQQALGQIIDNFSDGNITAAPAWTGTTSNYIVNAAGRLQLNAGVAGNSFLSLPFSIPANHNTQWEFVVSQNFSGSNQNLTRIYLMSDSQDPTTSINGYFLQFGETGSNDPIDLFKLSGGSASSILRGTLGFVAGAFNIRVRVTRSSAGMWEIFADNAAGTDFLTQGTVSDNTTQMCSYFIVRSTYTIGNISNFSYDDFNIVTTQAPDVTPPSINSITSPSGGTEIQINFSEALDVAYGLTPNNFVLNDTVPAASASFEENNTRIKLIFGQPMVNGRIQKIQFPALADPFGNILSTGNQNFLFFQPVNSQLHDIVINEIYADPSPSIGLPEFEFVEIYNRSQHPFQLENWQLTDGTTIATLTSKILLPGEFLTITSNAANASYSALGPTMAVATFPSLNNSGDHLQLKNPAGEEIDGQTYTTAWYHDDDKDAGGFSLELIDPTNFCRGGDNWKASNHAIGGTPGQQNSVLQIIADVVGPKLLEIIPKTSKIVTLIFDERMDATIPSLENFSFSGSTSKTDASFSNSNLTEIDLTFATDLDSTQSHTITLSGFFDCPGNALQNNFSSAPFKMDMIKPAVLSLTVVNQQRVQIQFSEKILPGSLTDSAIVPEGSSGEFSVTQSEDKKSVMLDFVTPLTNGKDYSISINDLTDYGGNVINEDVRSFRFFQPQPAVARDIVINELLPDQSPVVGLPEGEFVELYNRSNKAFNLSGWTITDGSSVGTLPDKIILPDQFLILCPSGLSSAYAVFGNTVGLTTFPSLNNSSDQVKLKSADGVTIDSIHYAASWYQDDDKESGGWSLERINPNDFCGEIENWKASENTAGGTPGKVNSIFALTEDITAPDLLTISVLRGDSMVVHFSERLSTTAAKAGNFQFVPPIQPGAIFFTGNDKRHIGIKLTAALDSVTHYRLEVRNIFDCPGNNLPVDSAMLYFKLDNTLPVITNLMTINESTVVVQFSEKIKLTTAVGNNFSLEGVLPESLNAIDPFSVQLIFNPPLTNGKKYTLKISGISDLAGNFMIESTHEVLNFEPQSVNKKDVIISEIFADPSPVIGLPETEYVEIYNRSENPVELKNWIIADASHESKLKPHILLPNEYLILTTSSKAFQFENVLGVSSFPTLTNAGEPLILKDSLGITIDSVFYSDQWYGDSEKIDGGWSLELIDPNSICAEGENWTSSTDVSGGTPGKMNSIIAEKPDLTAPEIVSVFALTADTLIVGFNEKLNEQLPETTDISITPTRNINTISFADQSKRSYAITFFTPLEKRVRYRVELNNVADCAGNLYEEGEGSLFALPEKADPGDLIINEVLFNPRPTGVDFVELFNRSEKFINLKNWTCANIVNDTIVNQKQISEKDVILDPGDYLALTADPNILKGEYLQSDEKKLLKVSLPSLSDDDGSLLLLDEMEIIIDTLNYSDDQHSPFLKNSEGVSLERIDVNSPASNKNNWQSASASSGYATPALPNSNAFQNVFEDAVSVNPEIFSPQSGVPDFAMISYTLEHAGFIANIKIVNYQGRVIKDLAENELLGIDGFFTWRGDTTQGGRAANGAYMVWFEMFDESGNVVTIKKRVVVADRF